MDSNSDIARRVAVGICFFTGLTSGAAGDTVTIEASHDNTLFQSDDGALSNGAGDYLFTGRTGQFEPISRRRALVYFDLTGIVPVGSMIHSATLTMHMSRTISATELVGLHRALSSWGEGDSDAPGQEGTGTASTTGDATWIHRSFDNVNWASPGGDYDASSSALLGVVGIGSYTWGPTSSLTADVQQWVDDPGSNHGWILIGVENAPDTAKRFDSREHATAENRPKLTVEFSFTEVPTVSEIFLAVMAGAIIIIGGCILRSATVGDGESTG